jgi:hypothetical protein
MPREAEDLTGQVFGTRRVIARVGSKEYGKYKVIHWRVRCDVCHTESAVAGNSLKRGANCFFCSKRHKPKRSKRSKVVVTSKADDAAASFVTVAQLIEVLQGADPELRCMVQLVSKGGFAIVDIQKPALNSAGGRLLLRAKLPSRLHAWDPKRGTK